jgi:hypothetical protein
MAEETQEEPGLTPLATQEDVESALGRDLTDAEKASADFVLAKLSDQFRRRACQTFTVETYTHRRKVDAGQVLLQRAPLVNVTSVVDDRGCAIPFTVRRQTVCVPLDSAEFATVTYTAGLAEVPDEVRRQIAESAGRVLQIDPAAKAGVDQITETTGPFTETRHMATWAVGGQAMLSPDDLALAAAYRPRRRGHAWVMRT